MVTELVKSENSYQASFRSVRPTLAWLELVRNSAMDRFEQLGFPSIKAEDWKYTNLATLAKEEFVPVTGGSADAREVEGYPETAETHLVVVDGFLREDLSTKTQLGDVVAIDLFSAVEDARYNKIVRKYLARNAGYHNNGLTALNTAFLQSGVFLWIPKNVKLERPLQITFVAEAENGANFPRLLVVAEENSSATLIESFVSSNGGKYFTNAIAEIVLKDGAQLEHYRVQRESNNAYHVSTTSAELGRSSRYDTTSINLGAQLSRHDVSVVMDHEGAETAVDGLYMVGSDQHTDTHSVIDHKQPHCTSHQLYKGILDGNGRAVFNGKVFVREGAQKTDAQQTNKNLLLSDKARVDTKPQLEIYADDVKCAHGAAVGQIDPEELFYLEARGIGPELGRSLLTYGFAEEVIGKIKIESIRSQLDEIVLRQLHTSLEA
ncbi:MAG TPA: Fe-S cluster assembly protein SufD [Pyrinomonadaceae bacterium]|jgi:Fe-S cluster assembly protein SufD|nr:Fe-S cluster assembly protein SufD [Pyrinomonadaceae bacterium]